MSEKSKVIVIGLGYIGLPTAATIAQAGFDVIGVDTNEDVIASLKKRRLHFDEPGLSDVVNVQLKSGRLCVTTEIEEGDVFIIAVPTPLDKDNNPDLSFVEAATSAISRVLLPGNLVILESTCPVGTTDAVSNQLQALRPDLLSTKNQIDNSQQIFISYCPERVIPGKILHELKYNDRVIGGIDEASTEQALKFYKSFVKGECHGVSSSKIAEMVKLTENSFRDVNIAFANELSMLCDEININPWEVIQMSNMHPRVNILNPGVGVGGHCIAVDPWFLISNYPTSTTLLKTARKVNEDKTNWVINKISKKIDHTVKTSKKDKIDVTIYGITFKPDVDDIRESPALRIAQSLSHLSCINLSICEPNLPEERIRDLGFLKSQDGHLSESDLNLVLVAHKNFESFKLDREVTMNFTSDL